VVNRGETNPLLSLFGLDFLSFLGYLWGYGPCTCLPLYFSRNPVNCLICFLFFGGIAVCLGLYGVIFKL